MSKYNIEFNQISEIDVRYVFKDVNNISNFLIRQLITGTGKYSRKTGKNNNSIYFMFHQSHFIF